MTQEPAIFEGGEPQAWHAGRRSRQPPCCRGFSLIELLVVLAIVAMLAALLLPAVQSAREAARSTACRSHVKQLALAALAHESAHKFFPTGGWYKDWLGHPDRGFGCQQPGGWIYNVLPFLEQTALHDLGAKGTDTTIEDANQIRLMTPLGLFNCPSRRPSQLFTLYNKLFAFTLTKGPIPYLARNDYAMNGGDYVQWRGLPPSSLAEAEAASFKWDNMSLQTGLSHQRSQVMMADVKDGVSSTFLIGEKYIGVNCYFDGRDLGDSETMYCGDDLDLLRYTGVIGTIGDNTKNNLPRRDQAKLTSDGINVQWFGSAHAEGLNMGFCDGGVRMVRYNIDPETYRRLGNRKDGQVTDGNKL